MVFQIWQKYQFVTSCMYLVVIFQSMETLALEILMSITKVKYIYHRMGFSMPKEAQMAFYYELYR